MRCYHVEVHGQFKWQTAATGFDSVSQPAGFLCNRWVVASSKADAAEKALARVRARLKDWFAYGVVELSLEPEHVSIAPLYRLLAREQGFVFYDEE